MKGFASYNRMYNERGDAMYKNSDNINYIVNTYSDMIYRLAYQYTRDEGESQDISQDVFMAMLKKMPFEDEVHLKAWLIRVTINKCKDYLKSSRRKNLPLDENIQSHSYTHEDGIEEIMQLPPLDRNIIYLYYYEGYSVKEIAKIVGKSSNAINIRLTRARESLKNLIEESDRL